MLGSGGVSLLFPPGRESLTVFLAFSFLYLKEIPRWTDFAGMGLIMAGLAVALLGRGTT